MQEIACPFCGRQTALFPGSTATCPSCGRPITAPEAQAPIEDDSATRPSIPPANPVTAFSDDATRPSNPPVDPVTVMPEDDTTRPSVLPPDAQPGDGSGAVAVSEVTADYPQPEKPERTSTLGAQATPSTEPAAPPISRRGPAGVIGGVLLVVLLLALAAAAILYANGSLPFFNPTATPTVAPTATPQPTATPAITLTNFTDADHVFTIGYPSNWLQATQNQPNSSIRLVIFSNPPAMASFDVGTTTTTNTPADQIDDEELTLLGQKSGIANRQGPSPVVIGGETWTQESGDVSVTLNGQATPMHAEAFAVIHGNHTVYMLALAPVDTFSTMEPYYQQIMQSFTFV